MERATVLSDQPLLRVRDLPPIIQRLAVGDDATEDQQVASEAVPVGPRSTPPATPGSATAAGSRPEPGLPPAIVSLKKFAHDQERAYIQHVLACSGQNKEETARLLEISLATLYRKLSDDGG